MGIPVVLLDIAAKRDSCWAIRLPSATLIAIENIEKLKKSRIPAIFHPIDLERISIGNLEDDLGRLAECDWVIEVVVEKLPIKQALMEKLEALFASRRRSSRPTPQGFPSTPLLKGAARPSSAAFWAHTSSIRRAISSCWRLSLVRTRSLR